jgi:hypothetical protein
MCVFSSLLSAKEWRGQNANAAAKCAAAKDEQGIG